MLAVVALLAAYTGAVMLTVAIVRIVTSPPIP